LEGAIGRIQEPDTGYRGTDFIIPLWRGRRGRWAPGVVDYPQSKTFFVTTERRLLPKLRKLNSLNKIRY
jgi:hypothetical protein